MARSLPSFASMKRCVVPDKLDLRDRPYEPAISLPPPAHLDPPKAVRLPVLNQEDTNACTGFALASVVNFLLQRAGRASAMPVSPFMLYSMARRYDEYPGWKEDSGSSVRGAMKGWYKHGVCRRQLWQEEQMPGILPEAAAKEDWWLDAVQRPLGAYYRVDCRSVSDMHIALNEVGILYASAICHSGWGKGFQIRGTTRKPWQIPHEKTSDDDGGHAFAIIGYDKDGFLIQNSWGRGWGNAGRAVLTYSDWLDNAMDCWVAQLGVVTEFHDQMRGSVSILLDAKKKVRLASDPVLRNREVSPFVIDMENNGRLSRRGDFRTNEDDLEALLTTHVQQARRAWGLQPKDPLDVAIYAHGGLTGERSAADTAARWIPALYNEHVFPIFLMWETDLWSTLKNRAADVISDITSVLRPTGGIGDWLRKQWNRRLERSLAPIGSIVWGEMKQNADALSGHEESGVCLLYDKAQKLGTFQPGQVHLHLIGHSAGSIVHCHLVERLASRGWRFESVHFMAPAARMDLFEDTILPRIDSKEVRRYFQYHLTDAAEQKDPTCKPILGYSRSLLYLVSESFEDGRTTDILGMEKHFEEKFVARKGLDFQWFSGPPNTACTTHGDFDNDTATMNSIIRMIKESRRSPGE